MYRDFGANNIQSIGRKRMCVHVLESSCRWSNGFFEQNEHTMPRTNLETMTHVIVILAILADRDNTDYMLLEINTIVASATSLPTHGPSTNITDNYVSGVRSGMPNVQTTSHILIWQLLSEQEAVQMCERMQRVAYNQIHIYDNEQSYSYTDAFEHSSLRST